MREPAKNRALRITRNLGRNDLTERVTIRRNATTDTPIGPETTTTTSVVWAGWDDTIRGLDSIGDVELVQIDATAAIRTEALGGASLNIKDEVERGGIIYTVEYVDAGAYGDGVLVYLRSQGK